MAASVHARDVRTQGRSTVADHSPMIEHERVGEPEYPGTQVPAAVSPALVSDQSAFWYPLTAEQVIPVKSISKFHQHTKTTHGCSCQSRWTTRSRTSTGASVRRYSPHRRCRLQ